DLSNAALPAGGLRAALNKRVRVTAAAGFAAQDLSPSNPSRFPAQTLEVLGASDHFAGDNFPMSGNRKYATLLCKWADDPSEPALTPGYFTTQLGNAYPGFDHYFLETSYGRATIA